jgi:hypothetical protein
VSAKGRDERDPRFPVFRLLLAVNEEYLWEGGSSDEAMLEAKRERCRKEEAE